jgi:hypothetical protein
MQVAFHVVVGTTASATTDIQRGRPYPHSIVDEERSLWNIRT